MNIEELKEKWGGSLPQVGDWVLNRGFHAIPKIGLPATPSEPMKVVGVFFDAYPHFLESFFPIPLTREVFLNIKESDNGWLPLAEHCYYVVFEDNSFLVAMCDEWGISPFGPEIKYLHQLQQLYRFFKRKELTYTPLKKQCAK